MDWLASGYNLVWVSVAVAAAVLFPLFYFLGRKVGKQ